MKLTQWLCRLGLHWFAEVRRTTKWAYRECAWCGDREAIEIHPGYGYQPRDERWLAHNPPMPPQRAKQGPAAEP